MQILLIDEAVVILVDHVERLLELLDLRLIEHCKHVGRRTLRPLLHLRCGFRFRHFCCAVFKAEKSHAFSFCNVHNRTILLTCRSVLRHCLQGYVACKNCPKNDLPCVGWEVKPYSLTQYFFKSQHKHKTQNLHLPDNSQTNGLTITQFVQCLIASLAH